MIRLLNVAKSIGGQPALRDVTLTLDPGIVGVVGANGSGKTTLLKLLATLIRPDAGEIRYCDAPYQRQVRTLRRQIGYVPQYAELPHAMTARALLNYLAQIRRVPQAGRPASLLSALRLNGAADKPLGRLSGGQIKLVCIAQAMLSHPNILLLDNVFDGLGIEERQAVARLLMQGESTRLTVFSTNALSDVEQLASHIVILRNGRPVFAGPVDMMVGAGDDESLDHAYLRIVAGRGMTEGAPND